MSRVYRLVQLLAYDGEQDTEALELCLARRLPHQQILADDVHDGRTEDVDIEQPSDETSAADRAVPGFCQLLFVIVVVDRRVDGLELNLTALDKQAAKCD